MSPIKDIRRDEALTVRALRAGHVRLGSFANGHPVESPTFVFTSSDRTRLDPLAQAFGGDVERYTPQGAGEEPWRLISEVDAFTALFPFGDLDANLAQDWTLWGRMGLKRRCDGFDATEITVDEVTGEVTELDVPCICAQVGRECTATTRVRLFLPLTGLVIWELVTHSVIGAVELYAQARAIAQITTNHDTGLVRMNHVPIRVVWAPRQIAYFDAKAGKRRTTTKRIVSLSMAGDAMSALAALGLPPDQALIAAVRTVLGGDDQLPAGRPRGQLVAGGPDDGLSGGDDGPGHVPAAELIDVGAGEPPAEDDGPAGRAAAEPDGRTSDSRPRAPNERDPAPTNGEGPPTAGRPSTSECTHPAWRPSTTRASLELCVACGLGRRVGAGA